MDGLLSDAPRQQRIFVREITTVDTSHRFSLNRRGFLQTTAGGLGLLALRHLLAEEQRSSGKIASSSDHPLARNNDIAFSDLATEPVIMKETGSGTRKVVDELFEMQGYKPEILMEISNAEFIKELVQRGEGISFLVKATVATELKEGKLAQAAFKAPALHLDVSLAYRKNMTLSPPGKAFVDLLGDLQSEYMHPQGLGLLMAKMLSQRKDN